MDAGGILPDHIGQHLACRVAPINTFYDTSGKKSRARRICFHSSLKKMAPIVKAREAKDRRRKIWLKTGCSAVILFFVIFLRLTVLSAAAA